MSSPLQPLTSIKVKLGLLVTASVVVAALVGTLASSADVPVLLAVPVTVALALAVTQLLAVGMTSPLREMTEATRRMARGDYRGRVRAESSDEVGELARAFNQMAAELATVDREQRDLVATVSHELRTPLAALTATLENLADGVRPADSEHLGRAVDQAQRLGALVGDLLDLSRVEAGVTPLRLGPVQLAELVDDVVADLVPTGRAVRFDVDLPDGLEVSADRTRLRQLLTNVLDNAVRHSPEGGQVRVRCSASATAGGSTSPTTARASLLRTASGPSSGSAPSPRPRATAAAPGSGLAIARWVAALHGGTVRFVDPPPGASGALLRLDLPLDPVTTPGGPRARSRHPAPARSASRPRHRCTRGTRARPSCRAGPRRAVRPVLARHHRRRTVAWSWPPPRSGVLAGLVLPFHSAGLAIFLVAADRRPHRGVRRRPPSRSLHPHLPGPGRPVHAADRPARRDLDRRAVPAGRSERAGRRGVPGPPVPGFLLAGLSWPLAGLRDLPWLGRTLRTLTGHGSAPRVLVTALWSGLALLVFGLLFVSADAIVASWVETLLPDITVDTIVLRVFVAVAVAAATLGAAYLALNPPNVQVLACGRARSVAHRFEWLVPVLLVDAVFGLFVAAQLSALFGGHDYVRRTTGLTYADYVHQGFGQLTVATLLTFLVVWAAAHWAGDARGTGRGCAARSGCSAP